MKTILTLIYILSNLLLSVAAQEKRFHKKMDAKNFYGNKEQTFKIIPAANNTFGYEILIKNKPFIRQTTIPGYSGVAGFKRKLDAEKVAKLVCKKIKKGIIPPTIEKYEMDQMSIIY